MNLPSGEICCPERPFRLSDSVRVGVCLLCPCRRWELPSKARTATTGASLFKGHLPGRRNSIRRSPKAVGLGPPAGVFGHPCSEMRGEKTVARSVGGAIRSVPVLGVTVWPGIYCLHFAFYAQHSIDDGKPIVLPIQSPKFTQFAW